MHLKSFFMCILISVALLSITSCSITEKELSPSIETAKANQRHSVRDNGVRSFVEANPDLFGYNILIFDSIAEMENFISTLGEADPDQLRIIYSSFGFSNPIMESNIVYDSVMIEKENYTSIIVDEYTSTSDMDIFLDEFVTEMISAYPSFCIISDYTAVDNTVCSCVSPLGHIDERALCNELGLFIVDGVVYKIVGNYMLTCPIEKYEYVADYSDLQALQLYLDDNEVEEIPEETLVICPFDTSYSNTPSYAPQENHDRSNAIMAPIFNDDHFRFYEGNNEDYKVTVRETIYPYWSPFQTNYRSKLSITNYYKGTEVTANISCNFDCKAIGWRGTLYCPLVFNRYKYGLINIFGFPILISNFKHRDFLETSYMASYSPTRRTFVDITEINVSLVQNGNGSHAAYITVHE